MRNNLAALDKLPALLGYTPKVIIVWADPEIKRMWFFQELLKTKKATHVIYRPRSEFDDGPTTYSESRNIEVGLNWIKTNYGLRHYVIVQTADVYPMPATYELINREMQRSEAVLFFWDCGIYHDDVWHTNFFAVSLDTRYWPPVSPKDNHDTLEVQWGKQLKERQLPDIFKTHNSRQLKFRHSHDSENMAAFPVYPQRGRQSLVIYCNGYLSLMKRISGFFRRIFQWLR